MLRSSLNYLLPLDERDGLSTSLEQSQKMVQTCNEELNKLKGQLAASYQQVSALQGSKEEVNGFFIASHTIVSLGASTILASVVQKVDNAIHRINHYPLDSAIGFAMTYPMDSDLSGR